MQPFGIYIIGDEILSGKRQDAHLSKSIELLGSRGLQLSWANYLGDNPQQITGALKTSMAGGDIVFSFGGIGATPDDCTRQSAAAAANLPIERHTAAVAEIEAQYGEGAYPKRVLMADLPQGATLIPNPINRVAGFSLKHHHFLPGFPEMAWPMMEWVLESHYQPLFRQQAMLEQAILVFDAGESRLIDLMNSIVSQHPEVKLFSLPKLDARRSVELGVKGKPDAVAQAMLAIKTGVDAAGFNWQTVN